MDVLRSDSSLRVQAPAKLNLFLEVIAKRSDGFHEIETLMTAITIYDTLRLSRAPEGPLRLSCRWALGMEACEVARIKRDAGPTLARLPTTEGNLIFRAAERLRILAGVTQGAMIGVVKRIPSAAGLGGGSSDAAATLSAANRLWQLDWTRAQLDPLATELGSDVPFFLPCRSKSSGMAVCRGRGERVENLDCRTRLHFVIVRPPEGLSTSEVYRCCRPGDPARNSEAMRTALLRGNPREVARQMFNRLQAPAERLSPWIARTRRVFDRVDCLGHQLSGSGTAYFGVCHHARQARRCLAVLRAAGLEQAFCAATTSQCLDAVSV
jgi:4-diphosphocytidyl-2-C-methyl-D-erythritol kinase